MLQWNDPLSFIHGLTWQARRALKALDVQTVGNLLSIFPRRYDDYTRLALLAHAPTGVPITVKVTIKDIKEVATFRSRIHLIRAFVSDVSGSMSVTWFNQPWLLKQIKPGDNLFLSGAVTRHPRFGRGFFAPLWEPATADTLAAGIVAPVYPLTGSLAQKTLRKAIKAAVEEVEFPDEWLPQNIRQRVNVPSLREAYHAVHRPVSSDEAERGRRRFALEELLTYQLAFRLARNEADEAGAPSVVFDEIFAKKFVAALPFELTADQKKAIWVAIKNMGSSRPMRRLLQGDVGSGKTIVAAMLCALVVRSGYSAALMAPTDLLAKQHAETFQRFLSPHSISILLQTSSKRAIFNGREEVLRSEIARERIGQGRIVFVGTHALLERGATPPDLALAVVDEQHRFGVAQRETLVVSPRQDGLVPHLLSMSATPIPRSLALTLLGDLEVSVIRQKPIGRLPVTTRICLGEDGREAAYDLIRREAVDGHRAFIVCPLIDESDVLGVKSVESEARRLQSGPLRMLKVAVLHGKLSSKEKDETMQQFLDGTINVLVATTVVEVGVDVPEATIMVIEGAERFGLAQLHQLRGRVGRSTHASSCLLIVSDDSVSLARLRVMEKTTDGSVIAEEDLRLRGEGNLLGTDQSGKTAFKTVRMNDIDLMAAAREVSAELIQADPTLEHHPKLRDSVLRMRETSHRE